jgi:HAD superfamily hydrolase (TIGR01509 family)|tara:strand:+ start:276 stop:899 length:624 start_codon:yes stop_codon:yes gene_type:complete
MNKLVVFDLDGVLVDACEWHRAALNQALKEICDYEISLEDHYSTFNGIPTKVKLQKLTKMGVLKEADHQKVYDRKQKVTIETIEKSAVYRREKVEMIYELRLRGYHIACFTNSIRQTAILMLDKTGVLEHLDYLVTNEDVENSKPAPDGYLFLIEKFNVNKNNVIIVEDSPKGIAAAKASGCNVIEVTNADDVNIKLFEDYFDDNVV